MNAQGALSLAKQITELEQQMRELQNECDRLKAQFENQWNDRSHSSNQLGIHISADPYNEVSSMDSVARKLRQVFASAPEKSFTTQYLRTLVPEVSSDTLRVTLSRLAAKEYIENVERGIYKSKK